MSEEYMQLSTQELTWTVQYGLHRRTPNLPSDAESLGIKLIADRLVEHFDRCGLVVKKKVGPIAGGTDAVIAARRR